ncbi:hypothetical protein SPRG_11465 [Saprolegnia parasitica CBS 223.65]|uniref:Uncharacterized protein n=1 Tax=Saprolegnia parasitica (strain CBS 223.65) TaxID=695850 RepID=A0A067BYM3_SAPPC|nr:hypothetical protein SPRG_11465 [Saprolegnia parasitica CBS 223.65]KDO23373.1 hypothetical protein SPRG_11465 [Saprolegnia parasitica CBS 223.65]|eukprot:XP_012205863.1 hypothetical protein SPRG_11465 [Saprolegnia parasitica CBS 223.65]
MSGLRSMETTHTSTVVLRCKAVVVGDAGIGKTALLQTLKSSGHDYPKNYIMTSSPELIVKSLPIPETNAIVELYLLDCPGQSIFNQREFGSMHFEGACMIVLVFDVNSKESFKSCIKWYQEVANPAPNHQISGVLIGNKADEKEGNRDAISTKEAEDFAEQNNLKYFECSARLGTNIDAPFLHMATTFKKKYDDLAERAENN